MDEITITLTLDETIRVRACLLYIRNDYQRKQYEREQNYGQDDEWQALRDINNYYSNLAEKFTH